MLNFWVEAGNGVVVKEADVIVVVGVDITAAKELAAPFDHVPAEVNGGVAVDVVGVVKKLVVHAKAESTLLQLPIDVVNVFALLLLHKFASHFLRIRFMGWFLSHFDLGWQFEYIVDLVVFVEVIVLDDSLVLRHLLTLKLGFFFYVFSFAFSAYL